MDTILLSQPANLEALKSQIFDISSIKYASVNWSNLGGIPSVFINVSLENRETWMNGIFQNSSYAQFAIHQDMKLEMISHHFKTPKHRKCKVDSISKIVAKIKVWAESA
jgi:hypothetical protein